MGIVNFLRDVGYTDNQTEQFMVRHYDRNKRSATFMEETQWKKEVERYSHGKPAVNGVFGKGCQTLIDKVEHAKTADKRDSHGCPFSFYGETEIKALLRLKGFTDENLIAKIAKAPPIKACQMELESRFPRGQNEYDFASPQGYVSKMLWRSRNK
jgi:hypothetical protein